MGPDRPKNNKGKNKAGGAQSGRPQGPTKVCTLCGQSIRTQGFAQHSKKCIRIHEREAAYAQHDALGLLQTGLVSTLGVFLFPFTSCFLFELNLCTAVLTAIQHRHHAYLVSLTQ